MPSQNDTERQLPTTMRVNWRVDDFCQAHGIGRTSFYNEAKRGEIKPIKIGKRTLVPVAEANAWQERKAQASR
jgi:predicted DNA-binding transcriptional regulator AlpA